MYKVAFFGSDLFSLASFRAVLQLRQSRPDLVSQLTLVTRELKRSGRGLKHVAIPEVVNLAKAENIEWYQIEKPQDFDDIKSIANLAVAVSYGSKIPGECLNQLKYGGLNVHPSLLPRYRGASPLQYAIMDQVEYTGVSVQTLHPTKFDFGQVLWKSAPVLLRGRETTVSLGARLAGIGAQGLVEVLQTENFRAMRPRLPETSEPSRAPIIPAALSAVDFRLSSKELDARGRALGKLFFVQRVEQVKTKSGKLKGHPTLRVNLKDFLEVEPSSIPNLTGAEIGGIFLARSVTGERVLALRCRDGYLGAAGVTVQGFKSEPAEEYFTNLGKRRLQQIITD